MKLIFIFVFVFTIYQTYGQEINGIGFSELMKELEDKMTQLQIKQMEQIQEDMETKVINSVFFDFNCK